MRQNYFFSKNSNALLEPYDAKVSCTVLRGESPSNGADLLDIESSLMSSKNFFISLIIFTFDSTIEFFIFLITF